MTRAVLLCADLFGVEVESLDGVAVDLDVGDGRDVLHDKPFWVESGDDSAKFFEHF